MSHIQLLQGVQENIRRTRCSTKWPPQWQDQHWDGRSCLGSLYPPLARHSRGRAPVLRCGLLRCWTEREHAMLAAPMRPVVNCVSRQPEAWIFTKGLRACGHWAHWQPHCSQNVRCSHVIHRLAAESECSLSRRQVVAGAGALVAAFPWLGNCSALAESKSPPFM